MPRIWSVVERRLVVSKLPRHLDQLRMVFDEARAQVSRAEVGVVEDRAVVRDRRRGAGDHELAQRAAPTRNRVRAVAAMDDQLGHKRVVVGRHVGPGPESGIDAHTGPRRRDPTRDAPGVGDELAQGVFGVDPHLDRVPPPLHVLLREAQLEPGGDPDLLLHEVDAGHRFGDGMLHLQPGVDLEKVELPFAEDELDRAGVHVARGGGGPDRGFAHGRPEVRREGRRGGLLHDLLVAALDRALALAEVHGVAVAVADDLDLDVAGMEHVSLEIHGRVAESRASGLSRALDRGLELGLRLDYLHPDAAAAA